MNSLQHLLISIKFKRIILPSIIGVFIITIGIASLIFLPFRGSKESVTYLLVKPGDGLNKISSRLSHEDLIISPFLFKSAAIALCKRNSIKSGEYRIDGELSIFRLIKTLSSGKTILHKVTIPEGTQMSHIFRQLEDLGIGQYETYESLIQDSEFINSLGISSEIPSLEGFLFPETYYFSKSDSEKMIIRAFVRTFLNQTPDDYQTLAERAGLTYYEAIILASIIEKETAAASERRLISSVMHNRLKKDMKLQTDPTVIYGIKDFDGNLTRKQLRTTTPYNTYMVKGLPPTPITNPGLESLIAAVQPAESSYLFFVAKGDGTHLFTSTYKDHRKAVYEYQKKRRDDYKSY